MADSQPTSRLPFSEQPLPRNYRWNWTFLFFESALFTIATSLVNQTTVLPLLIERLSGSTVVVGIASGLFTGAWLLPQVFIAGAVSGLSRKMPVVRAGVWSSRSFFFVGGLFLWYVGARRPTVTLAAVLASVVLFYALDAVAAVPWFDVMSKCIPPNRRGRLFGFSEVLGGICGIGTGMVVRYVLGSTSPWTFPANFAVLFFGAAVIYQIGSFLLSLVREPPNEVAQDKRLTLRQVLKQMPGILTGDRGFRRLVLVRLATGFVGVASAFYVLHATQRMGLGTEASGYFASAQVVGALAAGLLTSVVQDHWGPLAHVRVMGVLAALPASIALLIEPVSLLIGARVFYLYLFLFFLLGLFAGSSSWPFFNYSLEYASEDKRPSYVGLLNTLGGFNMLAPALGGWVVKAFSYQAVFGLALGFAALGLILSKGLPSTRKADTGAE